MKRKRKVVEPRSEKRTVRDEIRSLADELKPKVRMALEQKTKTLEEAFETGLEAAKKVGLTEDDFYLTGDALWFMLDRLVQPKENSTDRYMCFRTYPPSSRSYGIALEKEWKWGENGMETRINVEFLFPEEAEKFAVRVESDDDKAETVPQGL